MSKYQFHRLGSDTFQEMVQSLLEKKRRGFGELIQFASSGADGAREATWTQPINHPEYLRDEMSLSDEPKQWIFQVKYHDIGLRGWASAGAAVIADLKVELEKVTIKYKYKCDHYVLITNVPLTGASRIGTRDKISKIAADWRGHISRIEVWDAADLSRMLDNNQSVRTAYSELILPGDILSALHTQLQLRANRREGIFRGYLRNLIDNDSKARAEEAGDDDPLPLSKVFIDQTLQLDRQSIPECYMADVEAWEAGDNDEEGFPTVVPTSLERVSSAFPLLWGAQEKVMLLAGPGYGKSTITQFLALYHAGRIIDPSCSSALAKRVKLPADWSTQDLDAACTMRFPFRVELRRYVKWRKAQTDERILSGIASYIARQLIGGTVESAIDQDDIFELIASNPTLLILDGLDEVPNKDDRDALLREFDAFLYRCSGENVDLQIVMSSRPQGYHGEFDRFQPLRWVINDLSESDFNQYSADWLSERIKNPEERLEAEERIKRGMSSEAVRRLATTLLQATVMLTIVRKKSDIPEERHKLFEKYVDVVFQREVTKNDLIARYESELKLLHEMVGYQIHEGVDRGEAGIMPEFKFKELVWTVWRLIRGDERINAIPNQEIQSIYELSTDRLVFLSGKGANQSDIDFVIQPYREYFAAKYMANQGDADPEKVFSCLVKRGAYWQQVLRFFAAMTTPAQRLSWAFNSALPTHAALGTGDLTQELPTRRAVLFSIPEFGRLQFEQFRRIIAGCIPEHEWWTWIGQGWVISILGTLRSGEAWRELWKIFNGNRTHSYGSSEFALQLFPQVIAKGASEFDDLVQFISSLLDDDALGRKALDAALLYDLPVDYTSARQSVLFEALFHFPYQRRHRNPASTFEFVSRLPRSLSTRFICVFQQHLYGHQAQNPWRFVGLPVEERAMSAEIESYNEPNITISQPTWLYFVVHTHSAPTSLPIADGDYECYLHALFEALKRPDDSKLYIKAREAMEALPQPPSWSLRCDYVLGPNPDDFKNIADWILYKTEMKAMFASSNSTSSLYHVAATFGAAGDRAGNAWTSLLFRPADWSHLVSEGLVEADFISTLRQSRWAKAADLMAAPTELVSIIHYVSHRPRTVDIPIIKLIQIAVTLHNQGVLRESRITRGVFDFAKMVDVSPHEIHALINILEKPPTFPGSWASILLEVALATKGIDLSLVCRFWITLNIDREETIWLNPMRFIEEMEYSLIIAALEGLNTDTAFELAALLIWRHPKLPPAISMVMNRRAAFELLRHDLTKANSKILIRCLLQTTATRDEAKIYGNHDRFKHIIDSNPRMQSQIAERLNSLPQTLSNDDFPFLRVELKTLLSRHIEYPPQIAAAALDALILLDTAICSPITEEDWRIRG
ncbi:MAG: hypothetical protein V4662_06020 [Verrucomicrobiota bacterium]